MVATDAAIRYRIDAGNESFYGAGVCHRFVFFSGP